VSAANRELWFKSPAKRDASFQRAGNMPADLFGGTPTRLKTNIHTICTVAGSHLDFLLAGLYRFRPPEGGTAM